MANERKKKKWQILDIHTHNQSSNEHAIINYDLFLGSPLHIYKYSTREAKIDTQLMLQEWATAPRMEGDTLLDMALVNLHDFERGRRYSLGLHPWEVAGENVIEQWERFWVLYKKMQIVAIGEAGLDKWAVAPMKLQITLFRIQVEVSEASRKPLIIHCVKAMEELFAVRKEFKPKQPWIWHGFRGNPEQAKQLLKQGFYLSFGEYYPDETMAMVPDDRLFLETDNSGLDIEYLLQQAAKVRGVAPEVLRETLYKNAEKVFFKG